MLMIIGLSLIILGVIGVIYSGDTLFSHDFKHETTRVIVIYLAILMVSIIISAYGAMNYFRFN